ncbi:MAG TPA: MBL fold metallo-hydrolase, partial [Longimicrobiales bacterium]|nr:MBL fold metallo-hydrolase [Longimicrobiales bacterium]
EGGAADGGAASARESAELLDDGGLWRAHGRALPSGLCLRCAPTPHTDSSVAWRLDGPEGSVGYTGDTGYADAVADFLAGVDLLVAECSLPEEEAMETHLTPARLARLAVRAAPARLVATHVYPQLASADLAALVRSAGWDGPFTRAEDGLRLRVAEARTER